MNKKFKSWIGKDPGRRKEKPLSDKIINVSESETIDARIYGSVIPTKDVAHTLKRIQERLKEEIPTDFQLGTNRIITKIFEEEGVL